MADSEKIKPGTEVPLGMANPNWKAPKDKDPAPRLPNGVFMDPDDGTPVWYTIVDKGPDHEWTAGDLRAARGDQKPPPIVGPVKIPKGDKEPVEYLPPVEPVVDPGANTDLTRPARNVTPNGVPHFLRILPATPSKPNGEEVCGGCGNTWPCGQVEPLYVENTGRTPDGRPAQIEVPLDRLAVAKGMDLGKLEEFVERARREEIERTGVDPLAGITQAEDEGRRYAG